MLQEFPLMVSPFYRPPHQITLPSNYRSLPKQLPISVYYSNYSTISPQTTEESIKENSIIKDINSWKNEISLLKAEIIDNHKPDKVAYDRWINENINHFAPGFLNSNQSLLKPKTVSEKIKFNVKNNVPSKSSSMSQLSEVFHNVKI